VAVLKREEMLRLAERVVNIALKKGADEAEGFVLQGLATSVGIERGQIAKSSRTVDRGLGVRTIVRNAVGFSYTNVLESETTVEETVSRALGSAKASKPDKTWHSLPARKPLPSVRGIYDRRIDELRSEDLIEDASRMLDACVEKDKRAFPVEGGAGTSSLSVAIANSQGIAATDRGTMVECSLATIGRSGGEVTPVCFEFNLERTYDISPEWVGQEAARLAVSALKPKRLETGSMNVVFSHFAFQQLLHFTLINAVNADYVQRNQSAVNGKIGRKVASERVTVYDDGLMSGGIRTWRFDGEGVPQQKTLVIEKGVLRNFIYDNYTAKKEGKESTGNGARPGYLFTPGVDSTNFHVLPGKNSAEELVRQARDGLLVYSVQGAHSSNPTSGEFSVVASPAWKIKNGEVAYASKGAMVAGNIFQMLMNVSELASNERKVGQLVAPWVLVENVKVIGK
jgi:PmbA protein